MYALCGIQNTCIHELETRETSSTYPIFLRRPVIRELLICFFLRKKCDSLNGSCSRSETYVCSGCRRMQIYKTGYHDKKFETCCAPIGHALQSKRTVSFELTSTLIKAHAFLITGRPQNTRFERVRLTSKSVPKIVSRRKSMNGFLRSSSQLDVELLSKNIIMSWFNTNCISYKLFFGSVSRWRWLQVSDQHVQHSIWRFGSHPRLHSLRTLLCCVQACVLQRREEKNTLACTPNMVAERLHLHTNNHLLWSENGHDEKSVDLWLQGALAECKSQEHIWHRLGRYIVFHTADHHFQTVFRSNSQAQTVYTWRESWNGYDISVEAGCCKDVVGHSCVVLCIVDTIQRVVFFEEDWVWFPQYI